MFVDHDMPVIKLLSTNSVQGIVSKRSKVTVTDDSKIGTTLDGEKLLHETRTLDGVEHTIKLGNWEQILKYAIPMKCSDDY